MLVIAIVGIIAVAVIVVIMNEYAKVKFSYSFFNREILGSQIFASAPIVLGNFVRQVAFKYFPTFAVYGWVAIILGSIIFLVIGYLNVKKTNVACGVLATLLTASLMTIALQIAFAILLPIILIGAVGWLISKVIDATEKFNFALTEDEIWAASTDNKVSPNYKGDWPKKM